MGQSVKRRINGIANKNDAFELRKLLDAARADIVALRADVAAVRTALIGALAKLDDDATVTDTNYEALWTPAALTSTTVNLEE